LGEEHDAQSTCLGAREPKERSQTRSSSHHNNNGSKRQKGEKSPNFPPIWKVMEIGDEREKEEPSGLFFLHEE
jgi:hypothetical protein